MRPETLYAAALCAAFWVAWLGVRARAGAEPAALRSVLALALGACAARAGGLLWLPLGAFAVAPLAAAGRGRFLDTLLPAFPLACAVAKLGCLAAGCCAAAGVEALGFGMLGLACARAPRRHAASLALAGLGALRLLVLPLRPEAALSALPAGLWLALAALRCRPFAGGLRCRLRGSAISSRTRPSSRRGCAARSAGPPISR